MLLGHGIEAVSLGDDDDGSLGFSFTSFDEDGYQTLLDQVRRLADENIH
jgi:hypothetical protein